MNLRVLCFLTLGLTGAPLLADQSDRVLFQFDRPQSIASWQTVNDGVMGGRSSGRVRINSNRKLEFFGTLSLANNGGFASTRARKSGLQLRPGGTVVARVRGDGREYKFNLYVDRDLRGYSYRQSFRTVKDAWIEVTFPVDRFVATWRGNAYPNQRLDPSRVTGVGFLIGDKRPGPFRLEVDWIKTDSR